MPEEEAHCGHTAARAHLLREEDHDECQVSLHYKVWVKGGRRRDGGREGEEGVGGEVEGGGGRRGWEGRGRGVEGKEGKGGEVEEGGGEGEEGEGGDVEGREGRGRNWST